MKRPFPGPSADSGGIGSGGGTGRDRGRTAFSRGDQFSFLLQRSTPFHRCGQSSGLCLHLDMKAMAQEPAGTIATILEHRWEVVHFHGNDVNHRGPGQGPTDLHAVARTLNEINYRAKVSWSSPSTITLPPRNVARYQP